MLKFFATDVSVSKGYDGSPALRFSESDGVSRVRFRVGKRVYDSRCENNHRYINLRVKASGDLCERIRKMKLKEGSFINISGRYDEKTIKDDETGKEKTYPIIILDDIKFCFTGSKKNGQSENEAPGDGYGAPPALQYGSQCGTPPAPQQGGYGAPPMGAPYGGGMPQNSTPPAAPPMQGQPQGAMPQNFTGFENFGGMSNPFYPG